MNKLREYHAAAAAGFRHLRTRAGKGRAAGRAAGAISGSAIVKIIEQHHANPAEMLTKLAAFASSMKRATRA